MSNTDQVFQSPMISRPPEDALRPPVSAGDPRLPLLNLSIVRSRMDSLQGFLTRSVNANTLIGKDQMDMVSTEIASAIHQVIVNGAALLACTQTQSSNHSVQYDEANARDTRAVQNKKVDNPKLEIEDGSAKICEANSMLGEGYKKVVHTKIEIVDEEMSDEYDIIELDAVELLAEHIHFCDICGKGFKRDANLRMHMRAHGNQFKTPEALSKPERVAQTRRKTRFSCPFVGCNRNKSHKKFRPLKSVICVKNHYKRSHCPKMYSCNRCNKKSFSVVADLKSHLKHCGETKWKCSCGTSFSRKDKLFGHMALFEGHMPAVDDVDKIRAAAALMAEDLDEEDKGLEEMEVGANCSENGMFEELLDDFGSIENFCFQDVLGSPNYGSAAGVDDFFNF